MLQQNDPVSEQPTTQDPYPRYEQLRTEDPVHWNDGAQVWILTRYQDVLDAFRDPRLSSTGISAVMQKAGGREGVKDLERIFLDMMLFSDPPDHTRLRSLANKAFTPRVLERMRSQIQDAVDHLLDDVQERGSMEVVSELAYPLPAMLINEIWGRGRRKRPKNLQKGVK